MNIYNDFSLMYVLYTLIIRIIFKLIHYSVLITINLLDSIEDLFSYLLFINY